MNLLAGVDYVVRQGIADPTRLGIGGWSYGGILTDYAIARDTRFKAAISGAGSGDQIAMYGMDEYALEYNNELGPPGRAPPSTWRSPILFFTPIESYADPVHGGATGTSTSPSRAASRCTRRYGRSVCRPSW